MTAAINPEAVRERAKAIEAWFLDLERVRTKLATMPPAVRDEVLVEVRGRSMGAAMQGKDRIEWASGDVDICRSRVLSRARLAKFGRLPDEASEFQRQMAEVAMAIDGVGGER